MKAIIYTRYGPPDVLHLAQVNKPAPKPNEVLVKVVATTVTIGDVRMRKFDVPRSQWLPARLYLGVLKPRRQTLGMELAGVIESVGSAVKRFKEGDAVLASTFSANFGGYAEYKCLPESGVLVLKPNSISFAEAAAGVATGGLTALLNLRKAKIARDQKVLIYGASGSVGTFALQLAKHFGAEVTGVCSTANLDLVRSQGADHVLDYTSEDITRSGETYDLVFDAVGKLSPIHARKLQNTKGIYLNVNKTSGTPKTDDLCFLKELLESGEIKPVIDRCYPLEQAADAHRYVEAGHKRGNVVLIVANNI